MAKGKVLEAVVSLAGKISPTLEKAIDAATGKVSKLNLKAVAIGAAVGGIAVATGKAVAEAGKYLANLGDDWNKTLNQLQVSVGATETEMDELGNSVKEIYANNFGDSLQDAAEGLAAVKQVSGLTGESLKEATEAAFLLRDTFDYDLTESARAATALMENFGVSSEEAYGLIAMGAQNGADKNGDLLDTLNEYSSQYASLGLSADQFLDSLVAGADAGLFSIDKIGDAVKEFNLRAKDGSDTSADAFNTLGLNSDKMFEAFAAGGATAQAAFFDTVEALNELDDPLQQNNLAISLFGSQFEDLQAGVLPVLSSIEDASYDGAAALQKINEIKYNDLGSAIEQIKRTAETTLLPMGSMIANSLMKIMPVIQKMLESIIPIMTETLDACMPFVEDFLLGAADALDGVLPLVSQLGSDLLPLLTSLMSELLPPLLDLIQTLLPPLMQIVETILPPIISLLLTVLPMVTQIIDIILPILTDLIMTLLPVLTPLLDLILGIVNDAIMPLMEPIGQLVEAIMPLIGPLLMPIIKVLEPLGYILGIVGKVLVPIIDAISKIVGWVFSGLGWIVKLIFGDGGGSSNADKVNGYATGGFTNGLSIAGEDPHYPTEAVISFNPKYRSENISYWTKAGQMLGVDEIGDVGRAAREIEAHYTDGGGGGNPDPLGGVYTTQTSVYDVGGISFSPNITISGNMDADDIIERIKKLEPEFVDYVLGALERREGGGYGDADGQVY